MRKRVACVTTSQRLWPKHNWWNLVDNYYAGCGEGTQSPRQKLECILARDISNPTPWHNYHRLCKGPNAICMCDAFVHNKGDDFAHNCSICHPSRCGCQPGFWWSHTNMIHSVHFPCQSWMNVCVIDSVLASLFVMMVSIRDWHANYVCKNLRTEHMSPETKTLASGNKKIRIGSGWE